MFRAILEIAMLLSLVGGLFYVKHVFDREKQERRNRGGDVGRE